MCGSVRGAPGQPTSLPRHSKRRTTPKTTFSGINALWMVLLWLLFSWSRKGQSSFRTNLVLHWVMFAWPFSWLFPKESQESFAIRAF
jgi:hypothetical protein